ncbi:RHS repeat domain-containing protein [Motilibacter rhizosphaerae]|uniref:RHS repeat domain-containing protein n=1 Tax=Motilibacter rhizosphaerae TaxID=598652 RepID=UPI00102B81CB|nr:RHS repeat-associated core domain-containing protein [Motilibacter rhizosphaerae]
MKDRNGLTQTIAYQPNTSTVAPDGEHRLQASVTDTAGRVITVNSAYSSALGNTRVTGLSDALGRTVTYTRTGADLTDVTDVNGKHTQFHYTNTLLDQITTPRGNVIRFGYSGDRVTSLTQFTNAATATGNPVYFDYTDPTTPGGAGSTVVEDANTTGDTTYAWDSHDRVTKVTDPLGHYREAKWGPDNNKTSAFDATGVGGQYDGAETTYKFDTDYRDGGSKAPSVPMPGGAPAMDGAESTITYSEAPGTVTNRVGHWLPSQTTDTEGDKSSIQYDTAGNVQSVTDTTTNPTNGVATHSYRYQGVTVNGVTPACGGKAGQLCSDTNGISGVTTYHYDTAGNVDTVTPPSPLSAVTYTYDAIGRVKTRTSSSKTTTYTYDNIGRLKQEQLNNATTCSTTAGTGDVATGKCIIYTYDDDGDVTSRQDNTGTTSYSYDQLNRQVTTSFPGGASTTLGYDANGNVTSYTDAGGTTTYTYNHDNTLATLAAPGGSCTGTVSRCITYGYDKNGARTSTGYSGTTANTAVTRDSSGRPSEIESVSGTGATIVDYTYDYLHVDPTDSTKNKQRSLTQKRTDHVGIGWPQNSTLTYAYDSFQRLTDAKETVSGSSTTAEWTYSYDLDGNRLSDVTYSNGVNVDSHTYGYNAADELTSRNGSTTGWSYDGDGNQLTGAINATASTWTYPRGDQAATVNAGTATSYTYAGTGNYERTAKTVGSSTTSYLNSPVGLTSQTSGTATDRFIRTPEGEPVAYLTGGSIYYYLTDNLGTVVALIDANGALVGTYTYDPFGKTSGVTPAAAGTATTVTNSNPLRYTGGYLDSETGLYKLGARYYNPQIGRFTQADPSGQEANGYLYAGASPADFTDPSGLDSYAHTCAGGAATGGASDFAFGAAEGSLEEPGAGTLVEGVKGGAKGALQGCVENVVQKAVGAKYGETAGNVVGAGFTVADAVTDTAGLAIKGYKVIKKLKLPFED